MGNSKNQTPAVLLFEHTHVTRTKQWKFPTIYLLNSQKYI